MLMYLLYLSSSRFAWLRTHNGSAHQYVLLMEVFSSAMLMKLCICLEICLSSRLMSIVLWPGMTHLVSMLSQNACCGWRAWCHSQLWGFFFSSLISSLIIGIQLLAQNYQGDILPAPFWCLCQKLSLFLLYFNKTWLHKKLWVIKPHH